MAGRSRWSWALGGALAVGAVVAVALAVAGDGGNTKVYTVPSEAMEPTYDVGDKLSVDLDAYDGSEPAVGDVVVFHPPSGADSGIECGIQARPGEPCAKPTPSKSPQTFLKRVVAGPGDTVAIRDGRVILNGRLQDEPYVSSCGFPGICDMPHAITISPDDYFVLGDNRGASDDSRFWGPVPAEWILGRVE